MTRTVPSPEQSGDLVKRLRRTEKRKSYCAINRTAPIIESEYDAPINPDGPEAADALEFAQAEIAELRSERDVLLQKPIDLSKLDSIDEGACEKMVAYYWCEQAQEARAEIARLTAALEAISTFQANGSGANYYFEETWRLVDIARAAFKGTASQ